MKHWWGAELAGQLFGERVIVEQRSRHIGRNVPGSGIRELCVSTKQGCHSRRWQGHSLWGWTDRGESGVLGGSCPLGKLSPQTGLTHGPPPGLAYICEGLKEQRKGLVTLVLWNNQLTHTGMAFLGMTLVSGAGRGSPPPAQHGSQPCSPCSCRHSSALLSAPTAFPYLHPLFPEERSPSIAVFLHRAP